MSFSGFSIFAVFILKNNKTFYCKITCKMYGRETFIFSALVKNN